MHHVRVTQAAPAQLPRGEFTGEGGGDRLDDGGGRVPGQVRVGPGLRIAGQVLGRGGSGSSADHDNVLLSVEVVALRNGRLSCRYEWGVTLDPETSVKITRYRPRVPPPE